MLRHKTTTTTTTTMGKRATLACQCKDGLLCLLSFVVAPLDKSQLLKTDAFAAAQLERPEAAGANAPPHSHTQEQSRSHPISAAR